MIRRHPHLYALFALATTLTCTPNAHITIERPQFKELRFSGLRATGPCGAPGATTMSLRPQATDAGVGSDLLGADGAAADALVADASSDATLSGDAGNDSGTAMKFDLQLGDGGVGSDAGNPGSPDMGMPEVTGSACGFTLTVHAILADDRGGIIRQCDQLDSSNGAFTVLAGKPQPPCKGVIDPPETFRTDGASFSAVLRNASGADQMVSAKSASAVRYVGREGPFAAALIMDNSMNAGIKDVAGVRLSAASTFVHRFLCKQGAAATDVSGCQFTLDDEMSLYTLFGSGGHDKPVIELGTPQAKDATEFDKKLRALATSPSGDALVYEAVASAATALRQRVVKQSNLHPAIIVVSVGVPDSTKLQAAVDAIGPQGGVEKIPVFIVGLEFGSDLDSLAIFSGGELLLGRVDVAAASTDPQLQAQGVEKNLTDRVLPSLFGHWEVDFAVSVRRDMSGDVFTTDNGNLSVQLGTLQTSEGNFTAAVGVP